MVIKDDSVTVIIKTGIHRYKKKTEIKGTKDTLIYY